MEVALDAHRLDVALDPYAHDADGRITDVWRYMALLSQVEAPDRVEDTIEWQLSEPFAGSFAELPALVLGLVCDRLQVNDVVAVTRTCREWHRRTAQLPAVVARFDVERERYQAALRVEQGRLADERRRHEQMREYQRRDLRARAIVLSLFVFLALLECSMGVAGIAWFEVHFCAAGPAPCADMCQLVPAIGALFIFDGVLFALLGGYLVSGKYKYGINWDFQMFLWSTVFGTLSNCAITATGAVLLHRALGCSASNFAHSSTVYGAVATGVGALQLLLGLFFVAGYFESWLQAIDELVKAFA